MSDVADGSPGAEHERSRRSTRSVLVPGTMVLGAVVSLALFVAFAYGWYSYRSLDNGLNRLALNVGTARTAGRGPTDAATPSAPVGHTQNILITGVDSRAGLSVAERRLLHVGNDVSLSTDSIMVIHVPSDGSRATLISIPRDSYVDIPGFRKNKVNAAYADGYTYTAGTEQQKETAGANELLATVEKLTGVSIDHYVQVSFGGFYTIAKAIGGVPVNLCKAVDDTAAYDQATGQGGGSGFQMSAGPHVLDPVQALEFVRQRHNLPGGDLGRVARQRYFLTAAFRKIASAGVLLNPARLGQLIKAIDGAFYVDGAFTLQGLADQVSSLNSNNIIGKTIPVGGTETVDGVGDVERVVPAKVAAFVAEVVNGPSGSSSASSRGSGASAAPAPAPAASGSRGSGNAGPAAPSNCIN